MKTTKKKGRNATGMDESAKAEWRAAKSAQLDGRVAALKKLAATPDAGARKPKRSYDAPADHTAFRPDGTAVKVTIPEDPTPTEDPTPAATAAPVAEVAPTPADAPTEPLTANVAPTPARDGDAAAGRQDQPQDGGDQKKARKPRGERKPREGGCLNIAAKLLADAPEPMGTNPSRRSPPATRTSPGRTAPTVSSAPASVPPP